MLIEIDKHFIESTQIVSIEREQLEAISGFGRSFDGSVITLTNGRKVFIPKMTPKEIFELLKPTATKERG